MPQLRSPTCATPASQLPVLTHTLSLLECHVLLQTRSAAANPKGPYLPKDLTEHRPTLQSEYSKLILEQALDAALEDARKAKSERLAKQA